MRRSSDRPTTMPDTIRTQKGGLEELARRQGRGATALRNEAGHVMLLDPGSQNPLLRPQQEEGQFVSGLSFDQYGVRVVNPIYGTGNVDLTANAIFTQAYLSTSGNVYSNGEMHCATLWANGGATIGGQINLAGNLAMGYNAIYSGDIHCQTIGAANVWGNDFFGVNGTWSANQTAPRFIASIGLFGPVNPSERRLKTETGQLIDPLATVRSLRPAVWRWKDPERFGLPEESTESLISGEHVGIYVDEFAAVDPRAVRTTGEGDVGYEDRALMAYTVGAVQELADERDALAAEVTELRSAVDTLTARLDALEAT